MILNKYKNKLSKYLACCQVENNHKLLVLTFGSLEYDGRVKDTVFQKILILGSTLQFAIYLINRMKEISPQKSLKTKILGFLSIPLLRIFPPKPSLFEIGDLNWEDEENDQSKDVVTKTDMKVSPLKKVIPFEMKKNVSPLLHVKCVEHQSLSDLVVDNSMVGIIGDSKFEGLQFLETIETINIDPSSEIPTLTCIRPFSFSNIFVTNGFAQFPRSLLFKCQQIFSIRFNTIQDIYQTLEIREQQIIKEHSKTPIKKIKEKLQIKICPASQGFWVLINCCEENIESYLVEKLQLDVEKDSELIMKLSSQATVEDIVEIIKIKENEPGQAYKKQIEEKFNQKINCIISATQETNTEIQAKKEQLKEQQEEQINQSSNEDLFSSPRESIVLNPQPQSAGENKFQKKFRSKSMDISEKIFMKQIQQKSQKLWEEFLQMD